MRRAHHHAWLAAVLALACCSHAWADVRLSELFSDHMVLQRQMPVPVWGWAAPGEEITVTIDKQVKKATAGRDGKWMVRLDPMETGAPRTLSVEGKADAEAVVIHDVLLGEVWLCSGQSNMDWPLSQARDAQKEIAEATFPNIRFYNIGRGGADVRRDVTGKRADDGPVEHVLQGHRSSGNYTEPWQLCSPATAKDNFSAVAYFFGRDLHQDLKIPIGLIANAVGGSAIEQWISRDAMLADPDFKFVTQFYERLGEYAETSDGQKVVAERSAQYAAKGKELVAAGKPGLWPPTYTAPRAASFASLWFNARINPLIPYAIRGVIWYQGEAQWQKAYDYRAILPILIRDWRSRWGQGDFPFLIVQLPNWGSPVVNPDNGGGGGWGLIREGQLLSPHLTNTALAVTIDVGDPKSIHPTNKQIVGQRLAFAARGTVYREPVVYSGPIYSGMQVEGDCIRLVFRHVGSGLEAKGGELKQFSIAGEDMKFIWAAARIDGDTVVVRGSTVPKPVAVRYAWATNPDGCNLYNKEGLPASPFRTDENKPTELNQFYKTRMALPVVIPPLTWP